MSTPPKPKPSISRCRAARQSARAMPNSACTAGSITDTTYMPLLPTVMIRSVRARRTTA
jgi:hypothetical protein